MTPLPSVWTFLRVAFVLFLPVVAHSATSLVTTPDDGNLGARTVVQCPLRGAVIAANANSGADIITLPSNPSQRFDPASGAAHTCRPAIRPLRLDGRDFVVTVHATIGEQDANRHIEA